MNKILDTSLEGYKKAGFVITEEQSHELFALNCMMNADKERGNESDPVFYMMVLMRILGCMPDNVLCEAEEPFGRFIDRETLEP